MAEFTIKQSAQALGVSTKTIRRRIGEGELSATRELRGKLEVLLVDGAELARYAQAANLRLDLDRVSQGPPAREESSGPGGAPADGMGTSGLDSLSEGQGLSPDNAVVIGGLRGQVKSLEDRLADAKTALDEGRAREAWLQGRVQALEAALERERDRAAEDRRELLSRIPLALPPARGFWQRIFRGKGEGSNG